MACMPELKHRILAAEHHRNREVELMARKGRVQQWVSLQQIGLLSWPSSRDVPPFRLRTLYGQILTTSLHYELNSPPYQVPIRVNHSC